MSDSQTDQRMILRHSKAAIFVHWFNAAAWLFLLATGLGLIQNPELQPLGAWWPRAMRGLFGGGPALLWAHITVASVWLAFWLVMGLGLIRRLTLPFLAGIFKLSPRTDFEWTVKKNLQMTLGYRMMARLVKPLGWNGQIPPQPFYNAGQKAAAIVFVLAGLALTVSGVIMTLSRFVLEPGQVVLVQWSITIHFIAAGLSTAMLLLHIYMAAISREERPAFISMFSGKVPESYARHHHELWLNQLKENN